MGRTHDALREALEARQRKRAAEEEADPETERSEENPPKAGWFRRLLGRRDPSITRAIERSAEEGA